MKKIMFFGLLLMASVFMVGATNQIPSASRYLFFETDMAGANEVPPVVTVVTGDATFRYDKVTGEFQFKVNVAAPKGSAPTVVASHVHCAPAGQNGPVGVTLFSGPPKKVNGVLAFGKITAPNAGNACGWTTISDITDAMRTGNAYVNVHTTTFPSGEIRGQLSLTP